MEGFQKLACGASHKIRCTFGSATQMLLAAAILIQWETKIFVSSVKNGRIPANGGILEAETVQMS